MASPPHIPQINIPRKRNSISSVTSAAKKRKPSQLRNSFAPDNELAGSPARYSRSPSVDSVAAGSLASGVGGRRRKKKDGDAQSTTDSARGGRARSAVTGVEGEGGEGDGEGEDAEDDDDDLDEMDAVLEAGRSGAANRQQEKEHEKCVLHYINPVQLNADYL
jgi:transcription initiation factor TFIID subunit 11